MITGPRHCLPSRAFCRAMSWCWLHCSCSSPRFRQRRRRGLRLEACRSAALALHWRTLVDVCQRCAAGSARPAPPLAPTAVAVLVLDVRAGDGPSTSGGTILPDTGFDPRGFCSPVLSAPRAVAPVPGQWNIQSDEWVFNAPLMFSSQQARRSVVSPLRDPMCERGLVSSSLVFGMVHRLARRRKSLAAGLAVVVDLRIDAADLSLDLRPDGRRRATGCRSSATPVATLGSSRRGWHFCCWAGSRGRWSWR